MTNYVKTTNFLRKDSLPDDSLEKIIRGSEFDTEFNNLVIAVASKANLVSPNFSGVPTAPTAAVNSKTTQIATTAFVDRVAGALGSMSRQNSNSISVSGGNIGGTTRTGMNGLSIVMTTIGTNSQGTKTITTASPSGGANGDVWYRY